MTIANEIQSPLEQSLTRDGMTVHIKIYKNSEVGWKLKVIDEHGTSTVWQKFFLSDREALNQALITIEEKGIQLFVGKTLFLLAE